MKKNELHVTITLTIIFLLITILISLTNEITFLAILPQIIIFGLIGYSPIIALVPLSILIVLNTISKRNSTFIYSILIAILIVLFNIFMKFYFFRILLFIGNGIIVLSILVLYTTIQSVKERKNNIEIESKQETKEENDEIKEEIIEPIKKEEITNLIIEEQKYNNKK